MKKVMTVDELLARYATGERDFSGVNLSDRRTERTLRDVNLSGVDFSKGDLRQGRLERVNLSGANLSEINLCFTGLINCNLSGANLDEALLAGERTWMESCNCDGASFRNAVMGQISVENCTFRNAIFDGSDWTDSGISDVDFTGASFINCNLFNSSGSLTVARGGKIIFPDGKQVIITDGSSQ